MNYAESIAELVSIDGIPAEEIKSLIAVPKESGNGDYALPCFRFARVLHRSPAEIAEKLAKEIVPPPFVSRIEAVRGYLNFYLDKTTLAEEVVRRAISEGDRYGSSEIGKGKTICLDFSSINVAKPFHMGHLSTTVIGAALRRIFAFLGYRAVGINHLGDWGTQFGKLIAAYRKWGDRDEIEKGGVRALSKLYVRFHREAERDPSLDDEGRFWFKAVEDGKKEAVDVFEWFREITLREVEKTYSRLRVSFDSYAGESFYNDKTGAVIEDLERKGLLETSDGAKIVRLDDFDMPPCLIVRADGATLYATRDLAAAVYRKKTYDFTKCLYVVAYQQNLHFRQVFKVLELMGYDWYKDLVHVPFGMVSMEDGAMSSREGKVIYLEDVLDRTAAKALEILREKSPDLENKEETAETIGTGAVIFSVLYNNRIKDIVFSYDRVLSFEGETGPYVQYTAARCGSVLAKGEITSGADFSALSDEESAEVVKAIAAFPGAIAEAAEKYEPCFVARAVMNVCKAYNRFYIDHRILTAPEPERNAMLLLTKAARGVMVSGLGLLGIRTPEKM